MQGKVSICLVASGLEMANLRLQPWRYLFDVGRGLECWGYAVTLISDGCQVARRETLAGLPLVRLPGVRVFPGSRALLLQEVLQEIRPDWVLLHLGLTSFIHQDFRLWRNWPTLGIFTSPLYRWGQLVRLGIGKLWRERSLTATHLLGALAPRCLLRKRMRASGLRALVVQAHTTCWQLLADDLWRGRVEVIPPGVDPDWSSIRPQEAARKRREMGYDPADVVVAYFGSPAQLRGLPLLIQAIQQARYEQPTLKLLVLIRKRLGEQGREVAWLQRSRSVNGRDGVIRLVEGFLPIQELVGYVSASDLVALPFELVPSDAPLSPLEAQALGKPLVTTRVACLPELAAGGVHYLAEPGDPHALASTLLRAASELQHDHPSIAVPVRSWQSVGEDWARLLEAL